MGQEIEKEKDTLLLGGTAIKPKGWDRKGMEAFKYFLYNPDTGEILSRTPLSWLKIFIFYTVYYSCLAAFWAICLLIFFLVIPPKDMGPRFQQDYGRIGTNPGVGVRPGPTDKRIDSQMFYLKRNCNRMDNSEDGEGDLNIDFAVRVKKYMDEFYENSPLSKCNENELRKFSEPSCQFDRDVLEDCKTFPYGFVTDKGNVSPCLFLKLNKIYGWEPKPVTYQMIEDDLDDTYAEMTKELKNIIKEAKDPNYIWFDCKGRFSGDKEMLNMTFYPPTQSIPFKYFPFQGGRYEPPLVAVKLNINEAEIHNGQLVHVECRAWFDGVKHNARDKTGMVMFEVTLMEDYQKDN